MNLRAVGWLLGCVLLLLGALLGVPAAVALYYGEPESFRACLWTALASGLLGGALVVFNRGSTLTPDGRPDYFRREGLAVVGLTWLLLGVLGGLPYLFSGVLSSPVDAFFESASGFTTTGATILSAEGIDGLPRGMAFWRSFTHWIGGVGIVLVFVVLFPTGGRSLFRSEVPGVSREASTHVRDSALALIRVYVGLTVIQIVLLRLVGVDWFDSAIHAFGTLSTGGFSNHSASVSYFESALVEIVIVVFMFAAALNFALYDATLRLGPRRGWRLALASGEVRAYAGTVAASIVVIAVSLWFWGGSNGLPGLSSLPDYRGFLLSLRDSTFSVVSIATCTGYATADFDRWPELCRALLMFLGVIGACAGSTGGGIKVVRMLIVAKAALRGVRRFARPRAIHSVRVDGQTLDENIVASVTGYFGLWILAMLVGTLAVCAFGIDLVTSATSVVASLNNIGPGLGLVGPTQSFETMPVLVKLLLSLYMILGRLEFYAVVVLLIPGFWRR